jgi:hypothetical protein
VRALVKQALLRRSWRARRAAARDAAQRPCRPEDLAPLFDAEGVPDLSWLTLEGAPFADQLPAALAGSRLLRQLVVLGLRGNQLNDAGARALLAHAPAFAHLRWLNLTDNHFSPGVKAELRNALPQAQVGS